MAVIAPDADGTRDPERAAYALRDDRDGIELVIAGDWTALTLGDVPTRLQRHIDEQPRFERIDLSQLGHVDTAGVYAILSAISEAAARRAFDRDDLRRLAELVRPALEAKPGGRRRSHRDAAAFFTWIGRNVVTEAIEAYRLADFAGQTIVAMARTIAHPRRLRLTPLVAAMEEAGLKGIPITMTMTFFIGAVIALVGVNILADFGVAVFTVEMVGVVVLREFGVVIAAVLLAGRSASSFAAEIGAMRMNQEIDAMQVMGVDRFDALVVPRVLATLLMLPLMTFCSDIGGIAGGMLASWVTLDINPAFFVSQTLLTVEVSHFWIGMSKAPFLAVVIAATGCRQGFMVEGNTESLGRHVTAAVVQSIFLIIMFDAIFAMIFTELDL